eukprot:COSAG05_NODE_444_length_9777_cov_20.852965_3_plen_127_part_00
MCSQLPIVTVVWWRARVRGGRSCGLLVVATKVGGVPEVLPPDMILFSDKPTAADLLGNARIQNVGKYQSCMVSKLPIVLDAVEQAIPLVPFIDAEGFHTRVSKMYCLPSIIRRKFLRVRVQLIGHL